MVELGSQEPIRLGGPKFDTGDWIEKFKKWFNRYRQTIIFVVILAVIAGGIYFSYRDTGVKEEEQVEQPKEEVTISEKEEVQKPETKAGEEKVVGERVVTEEAITESAAKGEGITHLARKALQGYLEENPDIGKELTKEHKIYIEDYLKDAKVAERGGKKTLQIGAQITFSKDLIKQAIDSSKGLSDSQLKNIQIKYSPLVKSL